MLKFQRNWWLEEQRKIMGDRDFAGIFEIM